MSGGRRKEEPPQPQLANGALKVSVWSKVLRSDAAWEDKVRWDPARPRSPLELRDGRPARAGSGSGSCSGSCSGSGRGRMRGGSSLGRAGPAELTAARSGVRQEFVHVARRPDPLGPHCGQQAAAERWAGAQSPGSGSGKWVAGLAEWEGGRGPAFGVRCEKWLRFSMFLPLTPAGSPRLSSMI